MITIKGDEKKLKQLFKELVLRAKKDGLKLEIKIKPIKEKKVFFKETK